MSSYYYLVAVGSNLGDREAHIRAALGHLSNEGVKICRESSLVETAPIGAADKTFVNGAIICRSNLEPEAFMSLLLKAEATEGRTRDVRWGNRTVDLDILLIKNPRKESIPWNSKTLQVPHPRMTERDFVMRPAAAIGGRWMMPGSYMPLDKACEAHGWDPTWGTSGGVPLFAIWAMILGMIVRVFFAAHVPLGNDEAYYWDWGRDPLLSYYDHPPFVSWLTWTSEHFLDQIASPPLAARFLVPFCHLFASLGLWRLCVRIWDRAFARRDWILFLLITQLVPAFSLGGIMIMPDIGLILFSTWAVWFTATLADRQRLRVRDGLILGVLFGLAGLSKYHAALIGGGTLSWLAFHRRGTLRQEFAFWISTIVMGLMTIAPVIIWNAQHHWVSFLYQGARGISGRGVEVVPALRTLLGEVVFVGPLVLGGLWCAWRKKTSKLPRMSSLVLASSLPMLAVLKIFSFTSQTLPHWSMPSLWLLTPLTLIGVSELKAAKHWGVSYGVFFCVVAPLILSSSIGRRCLLDLTKHRPGGLGEMTLWDVARNDAPFNETLSETSWAVSPGDRCPKPYMIAGLRWFTVAQLAANLDGHPVVENFDPDKLSYYSFRSDLSRFSGCPVVIITERSHASAITGLKYFVSRDSKVLHIPGHDDRTVVVARGFLQ